MPEDWRKAIIVPLYKGKGEREECNNYRGISLLSVPGKIYGRILNERMMSKCQSAILPEPNPFALYSQLKVRSNPEAVLDKLKQLPSLVTELNEAQPGAELVISIAFSHAFWTLTNQPMPYELKPFTPLGKDEISAPQTDVDILIHCHSTRHDLHFYLVSDSLFLKLQLVLVLPFLPP